MECLGLRTCLLAAAVHGTDVRQSKSVRFRVGDIRNPNLLSGADFMWSPCAVMSDSFTGAELKKKKIK